MFRSVLITEGMTVFFRRVDEKRSNKRLTVRQRECPSFSGVFYEKRADKTVCPIEGMSVFFSRRVDGKRSNKTNCLRERMLT